MNTQHIRLDLDKSLMTGQIVVLGQGDKSGTTIEAEIFDNGVGATLTGMTAKLCMRLPDGVSYYEKSASWSDNVIYVTVDETYAASAHGYTDDAYFTLTGNGKTYSTSRFRVRVLRSAEDGADPSEAYTSGIQEATDAANAAATAANAAATNANSAKTSAIYAATAANNAAASANSAKSAANSAASAANNAAASANAATASANTASTDARSATASATAAAQQATNAASRAEDAIEAMGDISEQAVPLMSTDTRGGANLGDGLAVDDGTLHVGQLAKASTGEVYGPLASVTAKGHAEQISTTGKNLLPNTATSQTNNGVIFTVNADGSITANGTATAETSITFCNTTTSLAVGSYRLSGCPSGGSSSTYKMTCRLNTSWMTDVGSTAGITMSSEVTSLLASIVISSGVTVSNLTFYPQLELGSTATEYEPYTGGAPSPNPDYPQEIQVVRGRNLIDESKSSLNHLVYGTDGHEISFNNIAHTEYIKVEANTDYYVINGIGIGSQHTGAIYDANKQYLRALGITGAGSQSTVINTGANAAYLVMNYYMPSYSVMYVGPPQLTLGSVAHPYVPYGHVGLEVRQNGSVISTTPIPLPQRGWVASLPDGTADELRIDSAGHVEWVQRVVSYTVTGEENYSSTDLGTHIRLVVILTTSITSFVTSLYGANVTGQLCTHAPCMDGYSTDSLKANVSRSGNVSYGSTTLVMFGAADTAANALSAYVGATILYASQNPITEECGYVNLPDIPSEATVSIPELEDLGLTFWVDGDGTIRAAMREWYERAHSEHEGRILALEEAVAALVTQ